MSERSQPSSEQILTMTNSKGDGSFELSGGQIGMTTIAEESSGSSRSSSSSVQSFDASRVISEILRDGQGSSSVIVDFKHGDSSAPVFKTIDGSVGSDFAVDESETETSTDFPSTDFPSPPTSNGAKSPYVRKVIEREASLFIDFDRSDKGAPTFRKSVVSVPVESKDDSLDLSFVVEDEDSVPIELTKPQVTRKGSKGPTIKKTSSHEASIVIDYDQSGQSARFRKSNDSMDISSKGPTIKKTSSHEASIVIDFDHSGQSARFRKSNDSMAIPAKDNSLDLSFVVEDEESSPLESGKPQVNTVSFRDEASGDPSHTVSYGDEEDDVFPSEPVKLNPKFHKNVSSIWRFGSKRNFLPSGNLSMSQGWGWTSHGRRTEFATTRRSNFNEKFKISKNPTEMKMEHIEAFFYNHGMEIALGILYLSLNLVAAGHGAYQFSERGGWTTESNVLRVTLPIARAGGRLVTLNCAILLLTACKYLWTLVRTYVAPVVPIGFPIDEVMPKYHRIVALTIIFNGCIVHTLPQIVNYASRSITMDHDGMRFWTFGDGFATKQLLLTGTLLTIIFSSFFLTTLQAFRKTTAGFRWFWMFHITGIALVYPLLLIHGTLRGRPIFLYFALLPLALYLFDVFMRRKNIYKTNVLRWRVFDDEGQQITELVLERPQGFSYTPGQYAELKFAPISSREWHPFTIASAPDDLEEKNKEVVFYIKNSGRWTGALTDYARAYDLSKSQNLTEILIRGPHGAPAMNYGDYKHIIVIGSGVGVTPLLSIWKFLLNKARPLLLLEKRRARHSTGLMMRKDMDKSISIMDQSISMFNSNTAHSKKFLMDFSTSIDFFASYSLNLGSYNRSFSEHSESSTTTKKLGKIRTKCIFLAKLLESMTISLSLFVLFVLGETATILFQLAGWYLAANIIAAMLSVIAFVVHSATLVVWTIAVSWKIYIRLFRCWLELTIVLVDCSALWFSIQGSRVARGKDAVSYATASFISVGFVIALQAIRVFHIFYTTLKLPTASPGSKKKEDSRPKRSAITKSTREASERRKSALEVIDGTKFCSVEGILINRKYSNMKFAARTLLPPILKDGLTDVFSMEFYGTREKPKKKEGDTEMGISEHSLVGKMMGSMGTGIDVRRSVLYEKKEKQDDFFRAGRPDWNRIFLKAISKAHVTNEEGESVGVFFCGSPAIAKDLQSEARRVTAQHQFAMKHLDGKACKCKLIVHSENF